MGWGDVPSDDSEEEATETLRRLLEKRSRFSSASLEEGVPAVRLGPRRWFRDPGGKFLTPRRYSLPFRFMIRWLSDRSKGGGKCRVPGKR